MKAEADNTLSICIISNNSSDHTQKLLINKWWEKVNVVGVFMNEIR